MYTLTGKSKQVARILASFLTFIFLCSSLASGIKAAESGPQFKVIAFYNGTWDAAHISFVNEANKRFPEFARQYNFSYEATNDWSKLNTSNLSQYKVVIFLDDVPPAAQRPAFEQYMKNGGGWLGFHVSAFTQNPSSWNWYYNEFLGSGSFRSNTWGPTPAVLRVGNSTHPITRDLPATYKTPASEWYSWSVDLRNKPNIDILYSVDPVSFPLGTDPNQSWYSGFYPIVWSNKDYKMMYANMGHNDMNYANNTTKSFTFSDETQNKLIINALLWMGGGQQPQPNTFYSVPGTIEAENYSSMMGIQTESTSDIGGGLNVGWIDAGDWVNYPIKVSSSNTYTISYRVASPTGGGRIQAEQGNTGRVLGSIEVPSTGGWQKWTTISHDVNLSAGEQQLKLFFPAGGFNVNWIKIEQKNITPTIKIEAENYTDSYGVKTQATTDVGGGLNVGWIDPGDWMAYSTPTSLSPGTYTISYRVASPNGSEIQFERFGGGAVFGTISVPATGGWQNWITVSHDVVFSSTEQQIALAFPKSGGINVNWFTITRKQ
ncbi:carbohydrate-binding protein [Cohnella terricola]|uniref:Carbohydrate-binding protein n=1 Tax=Cohnella terricola TaxID=1289167 RepID=A0A559JWN3_9BACL|nr:carbohydrate-binding protein [Cohnella terricola]TVY04301.1 carbohydrate-binding protein [Cohnella terricola]